MTAREDLCDALLAGYVVEGNEPLHTQAEADALIDAYTAEAQQPRRGDAVEQWLKAERDHPDRPDNQRPILEALLDQYRLHADTGTPLNQHCCENGNVDDCYGCYEAAKGEQP